jgi:hypothetical protein
MELRRIKLVKKIIILDNEGRKVDEIPFDVEYSRFKRDMAKFIHQLKAENEQLKGEVRGLQLRCMEQQKIYEKKMYILDSIKLHIAAILFSEPGSTDEDSTIGKLVKIYSMIVKEELKNDSTNS